MVLKRELYATLQEWKQQSQGKTALLIEGARRVGKTTLVREFAAREYVSSIFIDFTFAPPEVTDIFDDLLYDLDTFFHYLSTAFATRLHPRGSLIIFDEVQAFPRARQAIKHLVADGRFDYVETGSLVSIKENVADILIPSEERSVTLRPLTFTEFLWALGEDLLVETLSSAFTEKKPLPALIHKKAQRLFREYMLVGGMPEAVEKYTAARDFAEVDEIKRQILSLYRSDIAKHAGTERLKVERLFDALPGELAKHEKSFTISHADADGTWNAYDEAFYWLADSQIATVCFNSTDPSVGLGLSMDNTKMKVYMADTGLLVTHAFTTSQATSDQAYRDVLLGKLDINEGMITENAVAQALSAAGHQLFFHSYYDDTAKRTYEVDFLLIQPYPNAAMKQRVAPVEVKSSTKYGLSSLDRFKKRFGSRIGTQYVLHPGQMRVESDRVFLPLYMAHLL